MNTPTFATKRVASVVMFAVIALFGLAIPAAAHTQLLDSTPASGDVVETPATVSFTFNEALIPQGTVLSVTDGSGEVIELEAIFPEPHIVSAELPELSPGSATVSWRVVSADGHPVEGTLDITVAATETPAPEVVDPTPSPQPAVTPSSAPEVTPSASPATPADADNGGAGKLQWLWIGLAGVGIGVAIALVNASRKPRRDPSA